MANKKITQEQIDESYNLVLEKVKQGLGIREAIDRFSKICVKSFYKYISEKQMLEIKLYKTSKSTGGGCMLY